MGKNPPANAGDVVRSLNQEDPLEKENGNPLQYSCLGNPMDRGAQWTAVHGVARVGHNLATNQQLLQEFTFGISGELRLLRIFFFFFFGALGDSNNYLAVGSGQSSSGEKETCFGIWRHETKMTFSCRPSLLAAASNPAPLVGRELHAYGLHNRVLQGWCMSERHL